MPKQHQMLRVAALAAGVAFLAACGGGSDDSGNTPAPTVPPSAPPTTPPTTPPSTPPIAPPTSPPVTGSAPVAVDDTASMTAGQPVTLNVLANDTDADNNIAPGSVRFSDPPRGATLSSDGRTLTVPGEGVWTVDAQGRVTFTPAAGFMSAPSEVEYIVADTTGLWSDSADIRITLAGGGVVGGSGYCHNPAMYQPGTRWSITYGGNARTDYTVLDTTTYRGRAAVRVQAVQGSGTSISYEGVDSQFTYLYGGEYTAVSGGFTHSGSFYYDPPRRGPLTLSPGQSFSDSFTDHRNGASVVNNFTVTFEALETITVPAGTFQTCRVRHSYPDSGTQALTWAVAEGRYTGMVVRVESYAPTGGLSDRSEATALSINR